MMLVFSIVIILIIAFALGSSIASFLCVVAERQSKDESLGGYSHCACGRKLKRSENIPVFGYLRAHGETQCGEKLPSHYLYSEITLGLVFLVLSGLILIFFSWGTLITCVIAMAVSSGIMLAKLRNEVMRKTVVE